MFGVPIFPLSLLCSAALVALWMVFVVLERIRVARVVEVLTAGAAFVTAYMYVPRWGFTWPH